MKFSTPAPMTPQKLTLSAALLVIFSLVYARLVPHPPNFTPLFAAAIFSGATLGNRNAWMAVGLPLVALLVSDLLIGFHSYMLFTYAALAAIAYFIGCRYLGGRAARPLSPRLSGHTSSSDSTAFSTSFSTSVSTSWTRVGSASLASSLLFFIVSNFGVWVLSPPTVYAKNAQGLLQCFVMAIPFFWNSLAGDLFFSLMIFGAYSLLARRSLKNVFLATTTN